MPTHQLHWQLAADQARQRAMAEGTERRRRARTRRRLVGLGMVATAGLLVAGIAWISLERADDAIEKISIRHEADVYQPEIVIPAAGGSASGLPAGVDWPSPPDDLRDEPIGRPIEAPDDPDHAFVLFDGERPVAYDPCRPIHVVVNEDRMPASAEGLVDEALAEVHRITGLELVVDGTTDETDVLGLRAAVQPDRYGDRWAPVLIHWTDADTVAELAGDVVGLGGSVPVGRPGSPTVFVTGSIALDSPDLAEMGAIGGVEVIRGVILHELGHVLGLDHTGDPDELMAPVTKPGVTGFGPGDVAGLVQLGAGPCAPDV